MICEHYQELVSALADGSLDAAGIGELQDHLGRCDECRLFMSRIYRTRDLLRAEEAREESFAVAPGFAAAVAARVANEKIFPVPEAPSAGLAAPVSFIKHFMGAAAAAAVLLSAGWSSYRLASVQEEPAVIASSAVTQEVEEEETMATYFREYALQTMDSTFLGLPQGVELAGFEAPERNVE
jgi:anti-sigma factor RsiW